MSDALTPIPGLTPTQEEAAVMLASGRYSWSDVCARLQIGRTTLARWCHDAAFNGRRLDLRLSFRQQVKALYLSDKLRRIASLERDYRSTNLILIECARAFQEIPGGRSGFMR